MLTECNAKQMEFQGVDRRSVVVSFDGAHLSSDGGALLLGELNRRLGVTMVLSRYFSDYRDPDLWLRNTPPCRCARTYDRSAVVKLAQSLCRLLLFLPYEILSFGP